MRTIVDIENSSGYIKVQFEGHEIETIQIKDMDPNGPLFKTMLKHEPSDDYIEIGSYDLRYKLLDKKVNIVEKEVPTNSSLLSYTIFENDMYSLDSFYKSIAENKITETNKIYNDRLNYVLIYYPKDDPKHDNISKEVLRIFKRETKDELEYYKLFDKYYNIINKYIIKNLDLNNEYVLCSIPSSTASDINNNPMSELIREITNNYKNNNLKDGSNVLIRKYTVEKSAYNLEPRSYSKQYNSIEVKNPEIIKSKTVVLMDDIYSSGTIMKACKDLLFEAGAKEVILVSLSRTKRSR